MKIGELSQKTGVSKETIHFYIRKGLLRKPRKIGKNVAEYNGNYVDQILLIKALRENYFLPLPVIKDLIKKQKKISPSEKSAFQYLSLHFRPQDRLVLGEVVGRDAFCDATGLGEKWLKRMEDLEIITSEEREGEFYYSQDDVLIGKLLVDVDFLGLGPKDGFDLAEVKHIIEFIRGLVLNSIERVKGRGVDESRPADNIDRWSKSTELVSLFFYHIYRKVVKEEYKKLIDNYENNNITDSL
jgi:DNA-binding transcriptional MerR regulator